MPSKKKDQQNLDRWHGAGRVATRPKRGGAHPNNLHPMTHGIWVNQCLGESERDLFRQIIARLQNDFVLNEGSDFFQVELVGVYSVKPVRAQINGYMDAAEKLDRMIRCHLKNLKATKIAPEGAFPWVPKRCRPSGPPPCSRSWPNRGTVRPGCRARDGKDEND